MSAGFSQAYFSHPMVAAAVIVHLATDGKIFIDQTQSNITVQLVDTKEGIHSLGEKRSMCANNFHTTDRKTAHHHHHS